MPLQDEVTGDILCFNGEIFGGLENMSPGQNDGLALLQALVNSSGIRLTWSPLDLSGTRLHDKDDLN